MKINISDRSKLEQLAEEAAELAQAALKAVRTLPDSDNPTPIDEETAWHNLIEETADVLLCFDAIMENMTEGEQCGVREKIEVWKRQKLKRWVERLEQREANNDDTTNQ